MADVASIILAAGKGTRMKSRLPKVLHKVGGRPMVQLVIDAVKEIGIKKNVIVIGHGAKEVEEALLGQGVFALQEEQLGTGHAVMQAEKYLKDFSGDILVLCGDTPLIRPETLKSLIDKHENVKAACTVLTTIMDNPKGYGRIIRGLDNSIKKIVEDKDASFEELEIKEINTGVYCFKAGFLFEALKELSPANAQGEYYLTDVLEIFRKKDLKVEGYILEDPQEMMGINSRVHLAEAEKIFRERILTKLMENGVTILDPATTYIHKDVVIEPDTIIYPQTIIEGKTEIGSNCVIGPLTRVVDCKIGSNVTVQNSIILESTIGEGSNIGPFAYLRPGTVLEQGVKVGDFVEIKKCIIGEGSKVPHLTYLGDATVGKKVNIGAGTITCNYDGVNKHHTVIDDGAFIGSNTNLVAPVEVGSEAVIAAGSTITKDVPAWSLSVARSKQVNYPNWASRRKKK